MIEEHPANKFREATVDEVNDRGNKFDGKGRLKFEGFNSQSGDVEKLCKAIRNEFHKGFETCNVAHILGGQRRYLPRAKLREIMTPRKIRMIVDGLSGFKDIPDKDKLTRDICFGQEPCWKLLAILIRFGEPESFPAHMNDGVCDRCLPMILDNSDRDSKLSCSLHGQHKLIGNYTPLDRSTFNQYCHEFMAPYIVCREGQHSHYILRTDDVFPMVAGPAMKENSLSSKIAGSYGGFSQVYQVSIDKSHYDFGDLGVSS